MSRPQDDNLKLLADKLRQRGGVQWRNGILRSSRVEFIRGKDFARYFRQHPEDLEGVLPPAGKSSNLEHQIEQLGNLFLRRQLVAKADRYYKKPKPGKKRLVKFPKKLTPSRDSHWNEKAFYAWTFDRPTSPWTYVFSALMALAVLAVCFFPMAPYWVKVAVLYISLFLLGLITAIFVVRFLLFFSLWVTLGYEFWLFPNITADTVSVVEAFTPLYTFERHKGGMYQRIARAASVGLMCALVWLLLVYSPDVGDWRKGARSAHDAIFDLLDMDNPM